MTTKYHEGAHIRVNSSVSRIRSLLLRVSCLPLAHVEADESRNLDVFAKLADVRLDQFVNRHVGVPNVRLRHKKLSLDHLVNTAVDDLLDDVIRLALQVLARPH